MSELEFQDEEREALLSIYEGDEAFKQLSPTVFQYKYGESENVKSMLLEIQWDEKYPNERPTINMDTFYNKHIKQCLKDKIKEIVLEEADQYLGMSMTYSLFEFVKEKFEELIETELNEVELNHEVKELTISENPVWNIIVNTIKKTRYVHVQRELHFLKEILHQKINFYRNLIREDIKKKSPKKEHLTKAQKRKQWDRACDKGERPRGWNWVDIVKHLSQTGGKDDHVSTS